VLRLMLLSVGLKPPKDTGVLGDFALDFIANDSLMDRVLPSLVKTSCPSAESLNENPDVSFHVGLPRAWLVQEFSFIDTDGEAKGIKSHRELVNSAFSLALSFTAHSSLK